MYIEVRLNIMSIIRKKNVTAMRREFMFGILVIFLTIAYSFSGASFALAEEVTVIMKNGDRVSGTRLSEADTGVVIETSSMGQVTISKEFIVEIAPGATAAAAVPVVAEVPAEEPQVAEKEPCPWSGELSAGYSQSSGNTRKSSFLTEAKADRKTDEDEINLKSTVQYSSSEKKMDTQKWYNLARYARSFKDSVWYYFTKIEVDHDYFANINYRITPSVGIGYWFSDTDDYKLLAEIGAGYQHTNYRDATKDSNDPILTPRGYFEKKVFKNSRISQEVILYPSLKDTGDYRMHSETVWTTPISDKVSFKLSFIDDYNSNPAAGKKKNDTILASSLSHAF